MSPSQAVEIALPLVQAFEGCRLEAYPDPATGGAPWTIGWGTTVYYDGVAVKAGDVISQGLADDMLEAQLVLSWHRLSKAILRWRDLRPFQQAALLSFSYNLGSNWFGSEGFETLTLQIHGWQLADVPWALMLYRNPGQAVEVGLGRRRRAEGLVWSGAEPVASAKQAQREINRAEDCRRWQEMLKPAQKTLRLPVPWFSQLDSNTDQARRMCFSSSCAMLLAYLKPGALQGPNGDDQYLARVETFGDTTDATAQIKALGSFGIDATFSQNADFSTLERQLAAGVPVPCGYVQRGPVDAPIGVGHWLIVVGITPTHVIVHDPFGEADLISGATLPKPARFASYSRLNFGKRWMVQLSNGTYRFAPGHGWAVLAKQPPAP